VTEIYDYLRLLFARVGIPHCPVCGKEVHRRTAQAIIDEIMRLDGKRVYIGAPLAKQKKGEFAHIPEQYRTKGFARARVDGVVYSLDEWPELDKQYKHDIELIVDRLVIAADAVSRITQSAEQALEIGGGTVEIFDVDNDEVHVFSERYACVDHPEEPIPELEPRLFSFNAPFGACPTCTGLGSRLEVDPDLVLNDNLTIAEGAIRPFNRVNSDAWWMKKLEAVAEKQGFDLRTPVRDLSEDVTQQILYGRTWYIKYRA
jgi:excinuclease ABC subunit A